MSQQPRVLVGKDVWIYALAGMGSDAYPRVGNYANLLGRWKDIKIRFMIERADTTPSAQELKEKTQTGIDWTASVNHQIRSGGGILTGLLFNGDFNLKCIFQEEVSGATFTAYGGITEGEYNRSREAGGESLAFENVGPRGDSGSSIFYSFNGPVNYDAASVNAATVTPLTTLVSANTLTNGILTPDPAGFRAR